MRSFVLGLGILVLVFILTGCQGFFDDYRFNPAGAMQVNSN